MRGAPCNSVRTVGRGTCSLGHVLNCVLELLTLLTCYSRITYYYDLHPHLQLGAYVEAPASVRTHRLWRDAWDWG